MSQLSIIAGPRRNRWTTTEIAEGLARPRFKPKSVDWNPLPQLERCRGWWQGAINVRTQCRNEDNAKAERLRAYLVPQINNDPDADILKRAGSPLEARDVAFAVTAGLDRVRQHVAKHEDFIDRYQRRMAGLLVRDGE